MSHGATSWDSTIKMVSGAHTTPPFPLFVVFGMGGIEGGCYVFVWLAFVVMFGMPVARVGLPPMCL